jgi:hypothetical protein
MLSMKIPVDLDVYKALEARRQTFSESHNDILRRALGISPKTTATLGPVPEEIVVWRRKGVGLPKGTRWRMSSAHGEQSGNVVEGGFQHKGGVVPSPSRLATNIRQAESGRKTNLNGWRYIEVKRPGDANWLMLSSLLSSD